MRQINIFLSCFFPSYSVKALSENDEVFTYEIEASELVASTPIDVINAYRFILRNDTFSFTVVFGDADPITAYSAVNWHNFLIAISKEHSYQSGELISATIVINKAKVKSTIAIYSLDAFINTLENLNFSQLVTVFNRVLQDETAIIFETYELGAKIHSSTIHFLPVGDSLLEAEDLQNRQQKIESLKSMCYFTGVDNKHLLPDDCDLKQESSHNQNLIELFRRVKCAISCIFLFDITHLSGDTLSYKINGFKSFKGEIQFKPSLFNQSEDVFFDIYKWVYNGGNFNDKIGLARNIITLHMEKGQALALKGSPLEALQSSYKVYEKQNIKQYIEVRNKMSDQLLDYSNRANKIIETFASGFQKSALAIITFYISSIIIKVMSKGTFVSVFTLDATLLSIGFIICSWIFYHVSKWEVGQQRERFVKSYQNMKSRYTDLLNETDIKKILNNDTDFNDDIKFIDDKLKKYSNLWKTFLSLLFAITILLFLFYNLGQLFNTPMWRFLFANGCNC